MTLFQEHFCNPLEECKVAADIGLNVICGNLVIAKEHGPPVAGDFKPHKSRLF